VTEANYLLITFIYGNGGMGFIFILILILYSFWFLRFAIVIVYFHLVAIVSYRHPFFLIYLGSGGK